MNRSSVRTLKCDSNTLPKPRDEVASRGGRPALLGKCLPSAIAALSNARLMPAHYMPDMRSLLVVEQFQDVVPYHYCDCPHTIRVMSRAFSYSPAGSERFGSEGEQTFVNRIQMQRNKYFLDPHFTITMDQT